MPRVNEEERIRKLEEKQARVTAEIQRIKARQRHNRRKRETRRKILAGAMVLDRVARGALPEQLFLRDMDEFLERPHERALFELPPRQNREKGEPQA